MQLFRVMKSLFYLPQIFKFNLTKFHLGILLSSISMFFGILREILLISLLGLSAQNDVLQLYLSIFYTIGITIDAMRLACLNLYAVLPLTQIIICASIVSLPFCIVIGILISLSTGGLDNTLLAATIAGSYLNLLTALLVTYRQRNNVFLSAQFIYVLPNFILIPGILLVYWLNPQQLIPSIIYLICSIPIAQCLLLLGIGKNEPKISISPNTSLSTGVMTFVRHFSTMFSEQLYQILLRAAFYRHGTGYLSMFAITLRIYSALRFILIDSFIGAKLGNWSTKMIAEFDYIGKIINRTMINLAILMLALLISMKNSHQLWYASLQVVFMFGIGFYFSTLVRIIYFKINHAQNNPGLVRNFSMIEFSGLICAFLLTQPLGYPLITLLWVGYAAKPFVQLIFLRKHYYALS